MTIHKIIIRRFWLLLLTTVLTFKVFCLPAVAVFDSLIAEVGGAMIFRCETGVRYVDNHGEENSIFSILGDKFKARLYFDSLRTIEPLITKDHLGPFSTGAHPYFSKDIYTFVIPETNKDSLRYLGYLGGDRSPKALRQTFVLEGAFYTKNGSPQSHEVITVAKSTDAVVLLEIERGRSTHSTTKSFTITGSKFTIQHSGFMPNIDMGFCEKINSH